jgi:hypothetical protein
VKVEVYSRAVFKCPDCCVEHFFDQVRDLRVSAQSPKWWTCSGCGTRLQVKAHWLYGFSYEKKEPPRSKT